ncbi:MAG: ABC transporter permease [Syntrophorhabdaceae bacterium]|nr:ABC transporter permease [Syntrophorhabdaceae bacterium]
MSLKRISAVFLRQMFLITSNPTRVAGIFIWLVIDVLQWGFISRYLTSLGQDSFSFVTVILGAIILWGFMSRIQIGILMAFMEDIWTQNLINYFASPLKISEYLCGLIMTALTTGTIGFFIMAVIAGIGFGYTIFKIGLIIIPFMVILLVFGISIGILIVSIIFRLGPAAEWLGWPIPVVLSLFSGVYFPISTLPEPLRVISIFLPSVYVFESIRVVITEGHLNSMVLYNLSSGLILSVSYLLITSAFFIHIYKKNLQSGNIARFNAEAL